MNYNYSMFYNNSEPGFTYQTVDQKLLYRTIKDIEPIKPYTIKGILLSDKIGNNGRVNNLSLYKLNEYYTSRIVSSICPIAFTSSFNIKDLWFGHDIIDSDESHVFMYRTLANSPRETLLHTVQLNYINIYTNYDIVILCFYIVKRYNNITEGAYYIINYIDNGKLKEASIYTHTQMFNLSKLLSQKAPKEKVISRLNYLAQYNKYVLKPDEYYGRCWKMPSQPMYQVKLLINQEGY